MQIDFVDGIIPSSPTYGIFRRGEIFLGLPQLDFEIGALVFSGLQLCHGVFSSFARSAQFVSELII
jgi:hypothetical protein